LVGSNAGTVTACYSTGSVNVNNYVGGLMGSSSGTVTACYAIGSASGNECGGLGGEDFSWYNNGLLCNRFG